MRQVDGDVTCPATINATREYQTNAASTIPILIS
jgi:hypothetical protein